MPVFPKILVEGFKTTYQRLKFIVGWLIHIQRTILDGWNGSKWSSSSTLKYLLISEEILKMSGHDGFSILGEKEAVELIYK